LEVISMTLRPRFDSIHAAYALAIAVLVVVSGCVVYDKEGNVDREATDKLNQTIVQSIDAAGKGVAAGLQASQQGTNNGYGNPAPVGSQGQAYAGQGQGYGTAPQPQVCPRCFGTGRYACPQCGGFGRFACQACGGAGNYFGQFCFSCAGQGGFACTACGGFGALPCYH
jgi:hypothetical protein